MTAISHEHHNSPFILPPSARETLRAAEPGRFFVCARVIIHA
jgi:hypothetical protein